MENEGYPYKRTFEQFVADHAWMNILLGFSKEGKSTDEMVRTASSEGFAGNRFRWSVTYVELL